MKAIRPILLLYFFKWFVPAMNFDNCQSYCQLTHANTDEVHWACFILKSSVFERCLRSLQIRLSFLWPFLKNHLFSGMKFTKSFEFTRWLLLLYWKTQIHLFYWEKYPYSDAHRYGSERIWDKEVTNIALSYKNLLFFHWDEKHS